MVMVPPVELPKVMVWVLAAVPMRIDPLPDPDVPTSMEMFPAVLLVEFPVKILKAPVLEVDAPEASPVEMLVAAELVPPAV